MTTRRSVVAGLVTAGCVPAIVSPVSANPAAASPSPAGVRCGGSRRIDIGNGLGVWTKHIGSYTGPQVLTLHGGPGLPHFYLECFEDFLPQAGIGYWYYDQLGCGFSDQPNETALWTIERYTDELEQVRRALEQERLVLFGHSWGGILAIEYALKYPQAVRALVISNMSASIGSYLAHLDKLRRQLPPEQQRALDGFEAAGDFTSQAYQDLMWGVLYRKHICRLDEWPEPVTRAVRYLSEPIYHTMQGVDEFHVTGNLRHWDRWKDLGKIQAPTLVIGARYDTMSTEDIVRMGRLFPNGSSVICENGSHLAMYDEQGFYFEKLLSFLKRI